MYKKINQYWFKNNYIKFIKNKLTWNWFLEKYGKVSKGIIKWVNLIILYTLDLLWLINISYKKIREKI